MNPARPRCSALIIPAFGGGGVPLVGRVLVKGACGVDCLRLGPERVLKSEREKCPPVENRFLKRKPTPQTPFTMPSRWLAP